MKTKSRLLFRTVIALMLVGVILSACQRTEPVSEEESPKPTSGDMGLPNPASVFCEEKGYTLEIRTAEDGSQQGFCIFPDGSKCDEWAYFRGECSPAGEAQEEATSTPTGVPVVDTTGWNEYTQDNYGFSFLYPPEWTLEEVQEADNTMSGHQVKLTAKTEDSKPIRMIISFKKTGEDQMIWPTGVGEGEFVPRGTVLFIGEDVNRNVLVCQNQDMKVFYEQEGGVKRDDLEFSLILDFDGGCRDQFSIPADIQALADQIVKTFELTK